MIDATEIVRDDTPASDLTEVSLRVLASGSGGNCSVLTLTTGSLSRLCLVDAGLSARKAANHLDALGMAVHQIDDVVLTHLDSDHVSRGWDRALSTHARVWVHERHRGRATRFFDDQRLHTFTDTFRLRSGVDVDPLMMSHDQLGVVAFRFRFSATDGSASTLGYATDLGRVTPHFIRLLRECDVLAIESNYCPELQERSERPAFLKDRITGGSGHLSNQETMRAVMEIEPREHVVLLHLSRDCNTPERVGACHDGADYSVTISTQEEPTRPVRVLPARHPVPARDPVVVTRSLFDSITPASI